MTSLTSEREVGSTAIFLVQVPVKQAVVDFAEGLAADGLAHGELSLRNDPAAGEQGQESQNSAGSRQKARQQD